MAWLGMTEGRTLLQPLYYDYPEHEAAYHCPHQYTFGTMLLAAPHTAPRADDTRLSATSVWLPPGTWLDFFSGQRHGGGGWIERHGGLEDIPLYARAGALVPLAGGASLEGTGVPDHIEVLAFAGAGGEFTLFEDDGVSQAHLDGHHALTRLQLRWREDRAGVSVAAAEGDLGPLPVQRHWTVHLRGVSEPADVSAAVNGEPARVSWRYDEATETASAGPIGARPGDSLVVTFAARGPSLLGGRDRRLEACRRMLRAFRLDTGAKGRIDAALPAILGGETPLEQFGRELTGGQRQALQAALTGGPVSAG
jgi:hypothetical protein